MKILVTGFEPFGGEAVNPSFEAVKRMEVSDRSIELVRREIPTVFNECIDALDSLIAREQPDAVLCTGQAGGRAEITVERIGINIIDASIPDNKGRQPIDQAIRPQGQSAYFSTIPIKAIVKALQRKGIPASVSNSAGTFVCNNILYGLLHLAQETYPGLRGGFVHVPYLPEQVLEKKGVPSMPLEMITRALGIILDTIAATREDISREGGAVC